VGNARACGSRQALYAVLQPLSTRYLAPGWTLKMRVIDWFHGVYAKYPWRGGFSALNFYQSLYAKIPYEQRPQIEEIQYASPGHIKLKGSSISRDVVGYDCHSGNNFLRSNS